MDMSFFSFDPSWLPPSGQYYFDVCVINIAVSPKSKGEFEEIWDLSGITSPRPIVYHIFKDTYGLFNTKQNWGMEIISHCVVEVLGNEIQFFMTDNSFMESDPANQEEEEEGDIVDVEDWWRF